MCAEIFNFGTCEQISPCSAPPQDAFTQGLALGCSLVTGTRYRRILLHTEDVPSEYLAALAIFWELRRVEPIAGSPKLVSEAPSFKYVFSKLHIFNPALLPFDRVLFFDLDTLAVGEDFCADRILESGYPLAAVACPTGYTVSEDGYKKKLMRAPPEGELLDPGATFNGGFLLVSPNASLYQLLVADCQNPDSPWHFPTSYPDSHYLKWIGKWTSLHPSFNLCPRMGKGQANTLEWQSLSLDEVNVFHFSTLSKPTKWLAEGTIDDRHCDADDFPVHLVPLVKHRALWAFRLWIMHLAVGMALVALRNKKIHPLAVVSSLITRDWRSFTRLALLGLPEQK